MALTSARAPGDSRHAIFSRIVVFMGWARTSLRGTPVVHARQEPTSRSNSIKRFRKMCRRRCRPYGSSSRSMPPRPNNMLSKSRRPTASFSSRQRQHAWRTLEDFKQLHGQKGQSRPVAREGDACDHVASALMARIITLQAAEALQSSGIKCLDVQSNPHLAQPAMQELCSIRSLERLECSECLHLLSPPQEVKRMVGQGPRSFCEKVSQTAVSIRAWL